MARHIPVVLVVVLTVSTFTAQSQGTQSMSELRSLLTKILERRLKSTEDTALPPGYSGHDEDNSASNSANSEDAATGVFETGEVSTSNDAEQGDTEDGEELTPDAAVKLVRALKMALLSRKSKQDTEKVALKAYSPVRLSALTSLEAHLVDGTSIAGDAPVSSAKVQIRITIENFCNLAMENPATHNHGGDIPTPAQGVNVTMKELMFTTNSMKWQGTYATVTWRFGTKLVAIMWSGPYYTYGSHKNTLSVGLIDEDDDDDDLFEEMYLSTGNWVTRKYSTSSEAIEFCDDKYCVRGNMGTASKSEVLIQVYPKYADSLAPALQPYFYRLQQTMMGPGLTPGKKDGS